MKQQFKGVLCISMAIAIMMGAASCGKTDTTEDPKNSSSSPAVESPADTSPSASAAESPTGSPIESQEGQVSPSVSASSGTAPASGTPTGESTEQKPEVPSAKPSQPGITPSTQAPTAGLPAGQAAQPPAASKPVEQPAAPQETSNVLIAYFSQYENTADLIPEGVDAVSSASFTAPGYVAQLAGYIQQSAGGDLLSIKVKDQYSNNNDEALDRATEELDSDARPEITTSVSNMDDYDTVFIGFPDWWLSIPMPVATFLEAYDFTGKTIVPFCSNGGSGFANAIDKIKELCPDATIAEGFTTHRDEVSSSQDAINKWLDGLGLSEEGA